jgi:glycosyltransferase involved in cell wall biosynthesis
MRIGISTSVIQRGQTGIAQYVFGLTHALYRHALEHRFKLFVFEDDLPFFAFAGDFMDLIPVEERFRPPMEDIFWHQRVLPRLAREMELDVIHTPSYRRMLWRRPCGLVTTIHDLAPFRVRGKYEWKRMFYARYVARALARRQDEIVAVSEMTARDVVQFFGIPPRQVSVVRNGIDHSRFFPDSVEKARAGVADEYGLKDPYFLYVSRLEHPAKNHVRLIEAFNRFKAETREPWQLVFVGQDWDGVKEIRAAMLRSPYFNDIRTLGFVKRADLPMLYRAAGAFLYPSLYEGFGLPPVEAMACGCPVICSPRGALSEVVGEAAALADPEDIDEWKEQMMRMTDDPSVRELWRKAGLTRARQFDWNLTASSMLRIYARAADRACGRPTGPQLEDVLAGR